MGSFRLSVIALAACVLATPALAQDTKEEILTKPFEDRRDLTLLRRVTEKTFVHERRGCRSRCRRGGRKFARTGWPAESIRGSARSSASSAATATWSRLSTGSR